MKNEKNNFGFIAASSICIFLLLIVLVGNVGKGTRAYLLGDYNCASAVDSSEIKESLCGYNASTKQYASCNSCNDGTCTGKVGTGCVPKIANCFSYNAGSNCKKCHTGYQLSGDGYTCTVCPKGSFCDGTTTATPCGSIIAGSTTDGTGKSNASSCKCPTGQSVDSTGKKCVKTPSNAVANCMTYGDDGKCEECKDGYLLNSTSNTCVIDSSNTCPENQYFNSNDKKCYSCPTNSTSPAGSTGILSCKCSAGTFLNSGNVCETCPSGFTSQAGSQSIDDCNIPNTTCDANKYFNSATKKCESCPANSTSPAGSNGVASCKCNANYYKNGTSCTACPANSTSDAGSNSVASCKCSADYYMNDNGSCTKCPSGYTSQKGSQGEESCVPKDNNCEAGDYYDLGTKKCMDCPDNSTSEAKSVGIESCKCNSGFRLNTVSNSCIVDCAAGKYVDGTSCKTCPANYYCPGNRSELDGRKYACPENSTSQSGSQSIDDCICKSGYVMNKSTQKCELKSSSSKPDSSSKPSSSSTPGGNNGGNNNGGDDSGSDNGGNNGGIGGGDDTGNNNGGNNNATNNPQTGSALIFVVWSIGIAMVVYAFWYFKTSKEY